jgi:hypothetical protein
VQEAEKQERFNEAFYAKFEDSTRVSARAPSSERSSNEGMWHSADTSAVSNSKRNVPRTRSGAPASNADRKALTKAEIRCYECEGKGHFARECPTRQRRETNTPEFSKSDFGKRMQRRRPSESKTPHRDKQESKKEVTGSGNGNRA